MKHNNKQEAAEMANGLKVAFDRDFHRLIGDKQNDFVIGYTAGYAAALSTGPSVGEDAALAEELERMKMQLGNAYRFLRGEMVAEQDGDPIFRRSEWSDMVKQLQQALKENPND